MSILRILVLSLLLLVSSAFIGLFAIKMLLDDALMELVPHSRESSLEFSFRDYGKLRLVDNALVFDDVRALGVARTQRNSAGSRQFDLSIEKLGVGLLSYSRKSLHVSMDVEGLSTKGEWILTKDEFSEQRLESVTDLTFRTLLVFEGSPFLWKAQLRQRVREIRAWAFDDRPIQNLNISGLVLVVVDNQQMPVRFHSVTNSSGEVHLEGNLDDLRAIAKSIEPKFTDADLQIAAKNLLKTPQLMSIRNKAELQATRLKNRDPEILYDVPRHIFWSYWLTQEFGPDFAREVTSAHEIGDTSSSLANTAIDHHHNELGIEYAKRQLTGAEVERLIFEDPRVVRFKVSRG